MNHHDIQLIEIGQREGYAKAIKDIVAMIEEKYASVISENIIADIKDKFGDDND